MKELCPPCPKYVEFVPQAIPESLCPTPVVEEPPVLLPTVKYEQKTVDDLRNVLKNMMQNKYCFYPS